MGNAWCAVRTVRHPAEAVNGELTVDRVFYERDDPASRTS